MLIHTFDGPAQTAVGILLITKGSQRKHGHEADDSRSRDLFPESGILHKPFVARIPTRSNLTVVTSISLRTGPERQYNRVKNSFHQLDRSLRCRKSRRAQSVRGVAGPSVRHD